MTAITTARLTPPPDRFPPGTVVGAYRGNAWSGADKTVAPTGAADTTATVAADGSLTFTGLTDQGSYHAYAAGSGAPIRFSTRHDNADDISSALGGGQVVDAIANISGATAINLALRGDVAIPKTLTGAAAISFTNVKAPSRWQLELHQDATGGRLVTWTGVTWMQGAAPPLNLGTNAVTTIEFWSLDGTTIYGLPVNAPTDAAKMPFASGSFVETMPKLVAATARGMGSGAVILTHFTPEVDITVTKIATAGGGTLASLLTLARMGLYEYTGSGNYTCRARTANDTTLWNTNTGVFEAAIADDGAASPNAITSYSLKAGVEYAIAIIAVGTNMPQLAGQSLIAAGIGNKGTVQAGSLNGYNGKRMMCSVTGQADLPASFVGQNSVTGSVLWGAVS